MSKIKIYISIILIVLIIQSCASKREWTYANIYYHDDESKGLEISAKKYSYFSYIEAKENSSKKKYEILIPEEVNLIVGDSIRYISMFFDEEKYGMESHSFGKVIAGSDLMIAQTKFRKKTCACKRAGSLYNAYFIIYKDENIILKVNKKKQISNKNEVFNFIDEHSEIPIPRDINTLDEIIDFIIKIQNL